VLLAGDLDSDFRAGLEPYDPQTQLTCGGGGGKSTSHQSSSIQGGLNADVVQVDIQIDDVLVA
jgi:ABC-type sulfate transport system substrate-binding protein